MAKKSQKSLETSAKGSARCENVCNGPQDLSRLELDCMRAIWLNNATTVLEVQKSLSPRRPLAYTTILTVMDRMCQKGALTRVKKGKAYRYRPLLSFNKARHQTLNEFIDFYFDGSTDNLIAHLRGKFVAESDPLHSSENTTGSGGSISPELNDCLL